MKTMIFELWDVIVVLFPFSDSADSKRRKAFVLSKPSFHNGSGTLVLAMITSAQASSWPGDVKLADLAVAGLHKECFARLKIFTIDEQLIIERAGQLSKKDQVSILKNWQDLLVL